MLSYSCAVVVCYGQAALLVDEVTDKRGVEDERLRAHLVAAHAFGEGCYFGGGESGVPDADFGYSPVHILNIKYRESSDI